MKEIEELIGRRIRYLEELISSLEEDNKNDIEELEKNDKKLEELKSKKNTLSLALTDARNKLDILERFYYSVDKLKDIEQTIKDLTEDDLENIDKIDSILDGVRDKWKVDVELVKYYLMHRDSIEEAGLKAAIDKVREIYNEIKRHEEKLHNDIAKYEEGVKIAEKHIREYRKSKKELNKKREERETQIQESSRILEKLKSINPYEIIELTPKYLAELRKLFNDDQEYLEVLKEIVKNNSALLKTNPKLDKLLLSVKDKLNSVTTFDEKEQYSELYLLLLYCKNGKDRSGLILEYLESINYTITDVKAFLELIEIDAEESLKASIEKLNKLFSSVSTLKTKENDVIKQYIVIKSTFREKKPNFRFYDLAKYLVVESEESIGTLYDYIVLSNVTNHLKLQLLLKLGEEFARSSDIYVRELSKVLKEIARNKYESNINENDIDDYQAIEELFLSVRAVDTSKLAEAITNKALMDQIIINKLFDEEGNIDIAKVKEILFAYKKKEFAVVRAKVDQSSGLQRSLSQLREIIFDDVGEDFIDDLIVTNLRDEGQINALLDNHLYESLRIRKKDIKNLGINDPEEEMYLCFEVIINSHSRYLSAFQKMVSEVTGNNNPNFEGFKPLLERVILRLIEEDLKNKTDSSDYLKELSTFFKNIIEAGTSEYRIYEELPKYIKMLGSIDIEGCPSKEELMEEVKAKMPEELRAYLQKPEEKKEESKEGVLILFKTDDEEELFNPDVNQNEQGKLIEGALRRLQRMSYDALTKSQGSVEKIRNEKSVTGLYRLRQGDIRVCYKVISPETIRILNENNDYSYEAGIIVFYIFKKHDNIDIYPDVVIPLAKEFARKKEREIEEELTAGSRESVDNTIRAHERIYRRYTGQAESGIGAKTYE